MNEKNSSYIFLNKYDINKIKYIQKVKINGDNMTNQEFIKNIDFAKPLILAELVDYEEGRVVSRTLAQQQNASITLFAFEAGEGLSAHSAPGDAMVTILDGEALITIDGNPNIVKAGEVIIMPSNITHALDAQKKFKMLLIIIK